MDSAGQTTSYVSLLMREQPTTLEDYIYHLGSTTLRWRCLAACVLAYRAYNLLTRSAYCYRYISIDDALLDRRLAVADTSRLCAAACTFSFFAKPYDAHTSRSLPPLLSGVPQHHPDDHSFSAALQRTFLDHRALHFSAPTPFGASHASEQNPFVVVISYQLAAGGDKRSPSSTQTHSHSRRSAMLLNGPWN